MLTTFANMIEACGTKAPLMRRSLWLAFASSIVQGLAYATLFPLLAALIEDSSDVWNWFAVLLALVLVDSVLRFFEVRTGWRIYIEVAEETRAQLGEQLKRMPQQSLAHRNTGDLNSVLTGNVNDVVSIAGGLFGIVVNTIVAPTVTIIATFFVDWRLALAMIVIFPLAIPLYRGIRRVAARENRIVVDAHADAASHIVEYIQGLGVLRATQQVGPRAAGLQGSLARLRAAQTRGTTLGTLPSILMSAIVQLGIVGVTALAVALLLSNSLDVAAVLAVIVIAVRFSEPLSLFANMATMFDFMESAIDRIGDLMAVQPLPVIAAVGATSPASSGGDNSPVVNFAGVGFTYSGSDTPVLRDVSFTMQPHTLTALVGPSGSGKTTVTRLLTRFADPQTGSITVGGDDIRSLEQADLMRHFSVVFQDVYLFDDTIRENIRLADPDATNDDIEAAARAANCHDFVAALPAGYDTVVGEIGGALSGGERQRISIARAILKDAPIVVLDEPTSALDTENEVAVQRAIDTLVADKTVLVIAHRLSTVVAADTILVFDSGRIVETGDHHTLLTRGGRYAQLWDAQRSERQWQMTSAPT